MRIRRAEEYPDAEWFVTSDSDSGSSCVEVAHLPEATVVRHSREPEGPVLEFTPAEWDRFLAGVKRDEFDRTG